MSVRRTASPPSRFKSQTWLFPPLREEVNARYLPSGLQRGCPEELPSAVRGSTPPPTRQAESALRLSRWHPAALAPKLETRKRSCEQFSCQKLLGLKFGRSV